MPPRSSLLELLPQVASLPKGQSMPSLAPASEHASTGLLPKSVRRRPIFFFIGDRDAAVITCVSTKSPMPVGLSYLTLPRNAFSTRLFNP